MAKRSGHQQRRRSRDAFLQAALKFITVGISLLVVSWFAGSHPVLKAITSGLRIPAWLAVVLGVGMLALHKLRARNTSVPTASDNQAPKPTGTATTPPDNPNQTNATPPQPCRQWCAQVFADIEWRRFEAVCEQLFGQAGFQTRSQSHGADGGVDIWLHSRHVAGPASVVQCKHWHNKTVGVKELREFFGVMASRNIAHGTFATSSRYSTDAAQFAKANGIHLLDGQGLLALIAKRSPQQQQELLATAYEGEFWRPTCASCGIKMVYRQGANGQANFWGCSNYPRCQVTLQAARTR